MTLIPTTIADDDQRSNALLRAIGFDKLSEPQRELALGIAGRYNLDPMLKHLVMIEGRPYITRDGLLHVAHASGQFDGIETTAPTLDEDGKHWRSEAAVYRKDMTRPFRYTGRYPATGGNAKYAPEMAVKVAEVAALRRAFDVAAPTLEERWDEANAPADVAPAPSPASLADIVAEKAASIAPEAVETTETPATPEVEPVPTLTVVAPQDGPTMDEFGYLVRGEDKARIKATAKRLFPDVTKFADLKPAQLQAILDELAAYAESVDEDAGFDPGRPTVANGGIVLCAAPSTLSDSTCTMDAGHSGAHRSGTRESW